MAALILVLMALIFIPVALDAQRVKTGGHARMPGFLGRFATRWGEWAAANSGKAREDLKAMFRRPVRSLRSLPATSGVEVERPAYPVDDDPAAVDARTREARRDRLEKYEQELKPYTPPAIEAEEDFADEIEHRAYAARKAFRNSEIDEAQYRATIKSELKSARNMRQLEKPEEWMDELEKFEAEEKYDRLCDTVSLLTELQGDIDFEADRRIEATDERWSEMPSGKWSRFVYTDSHGQRSSREIVNWESRGAYIVGFDRAKQGERTFRKGQIEEWVAG